ncbi:MULTISPECIES: hypothetical protein [Ralstonia]|jgi:hypothetical protein|uniref:Lipoprotein n=1 Tax=Ralstonia flaminis TaxID=3058597 RepID=A0ABN9JR91_9RALS|nr:MULTISPECIES: hypothetical protein [unclassified Ralstonia]CAJ0821851.1 hypothetical protein LMG18101_04767 [Ralstonia sp. LMG 18101]
MKSALYAPSLVLLTLLGACGSPAPSQQQLADQANTSNSVITDNGWQALRVRYFDCVQRRADEQVTSQADTKTVVSSVLDACEGELKTMHDAFHDYLSAQMVSSHGKSGARQAANQVTESSREKARVFATDYVNYARYQQAKAR